MRTAGVLFTFARYAYTAHTLLSLERQTEQVDWYVYQDALVGHPPKKFGYTKVDQWGVDAVAELVRSSTLPIQKFEQNDVNQGINYQVNKAFQLFESYDAVCFFEDDMIVSPHYVRLLKQFATEHPMVMATFHSLGDPDKNKLHCMQHALKPRSWGFVLTRTAFNVIAPYWQAAFDAGPRNPYYDVVITHLARNYLYGKWQAVVPRAICVGQNGVLSTNPENWEKRGLHNQTKTYIYEEDATIGSFELC